MVGILITGHGNFATGLGTGLQYVTGIKENVVFVDFETGHSTDMLTENLEAAFDKLKECDGVLVLVDIVGGSPFQKAVEYKYEHLDRNIEVVAGINLPMVIEGGMIMDIYDSPLEMAEVLISTGKNYIFRFELTEDNLSENKVNI